MGGTAGAALVTFGLKGKRLCRQHLGEAGGMQIRREQLRRLADPRSWPQSVRYFLQQRVRSLLRHRDAVVATIAGGRDYCVTLRRGDAPAPSAPEKPAIGNGR